LPDLMYNNPTEISEEDLPTDGSVMDPNFLSGGASSSNQAQQAGSQEAADQRSEGSNVADPKFLGGAADEKK
ncbi:MAG: hypothetical protein ACO24Y_10890, partial [Hylemonella sp.]